MGRKLISKKIIKCLECGIVFECSDNKRNKDRKYCSSFCGKSANGKNNIGKKRTDEYKQMMSMRNSGENNPFFRKKHSTESRQKMSISQTGTQIGEKHPNWKGGIKSRPDGYLRRSSDDKYVHRIIMENYLGRQLRDYEIVHHIDGNVSNNDISNLTVMTNSSHRKIHVVEQQRNSLGIFI